MSLNCKVRINSWLSFIRKFIINNLIKSDPKTNTLKSRVKKGIYALLGLYLLIWISSSFIANYFVGEILETDYGLELSEQATIRYNPFTSHLTIRDVSISKQGQQVFQLEKGDMEIRLHRLVMKQIYVSQFKLDGLFLAVEKNGAASQVAGIKLQSKSEPVVDAALSSEAEAESDPTKFELIMPGFEFLGGKVAIKIDDDVHAFGVKQFSITNTALSLEKQSFASRIEVSLDNAPIEIDISLDAKNNLGELIINMSLKDYQLTHLAKQLPENIHALNGLLSFRSSNKINFVKNEIVISSSNTTIEIHDLEFENDLIQIKQSEQVLSISDLQLNLSHGLDNTKSHLGIEIRQASLKGGEIAVKLNEVEFSNLGQQSNVSNITLGLNSDSSISAQIAELSINALASQGQKNNLLFESEGLRLTLNDIDLNQTSSGILKIAAHSDLHLNKIVSYIENKSQLLARIAETQVKNITLKSDQQHNFSFEQLLVKDSVFSNVKTNDGKTNDYVPELVSFNHFLLNDFKFNLEQVEIASVQIDGLNANVHIDKNKNIKNLVPLELLGSKEPLTVVEQQPDMERKSKLQDEESSTKPASDNPSIKVDLFELTNTKTFAFVDQSVSPEYRRDIFIDEMLIQNIDANKPLQQSPFSIKGRSDRYTKFDFSGFIKPFTQKTNLTVKGKLVEVSLPPASSYIQPVMGFQFESGELDTSLDIEIKDSEISGTTGVYIRGLDLAATEDYQQDTLEEQTAMPLNVALGMLKDGDGNVELDIPMLGDLDSPSFGYSSFIALITKKAIQSAAQTYLIKTFIPYAEILSITFSAGEFILKTRFEDLIYEPAQIAISESQFAYMQQFITLMKDKKSTQVKVCAIATATDLVEEGTQTQIEEEKILKLKKLAQERMIAFEEYAVAQGIDSSRILTCIPGVDLSIETQPKIVISV